MLKIKDNVDLENLEKFGFELYKRNETEFYRKKLETSGNTAYLKVQPISKEIIIDTEVTYILELVDLYNLITAGLVEKIDN